MLHLTVPVGLEGVLRLAELPEPGWEERWDRIIVSEALKNRLLNYALFTLRQRGRLSTVGLPLHGLVVLSGPPGTGKTTLASGLADRAARVLDVTLLYAEIDPHAFPSQMLGESQRAVARLFERTIPDLAARGAPTVVLLDEVEALAVTRSGASLETNPVDVHRATDAVLSGLDSVAASCPNVLFLATTNLERAVDPAFLSRADLIEAIDLPGREAVEAILFDTMREITPDGKLDRSGLGVVSERCVAAGLDARQVRKLVLQAIVTRRELALDPSLLATEDLAAALEARGDGAPRP